MEILFNWKPKQSVSCVKNSQNAVYLGIRMLINTSFKYVLALLITGAET